MSHSVALRALREDSTELAPCTWRAKSAGITSSCTEMRPGATAVNLLCGSAQASSDQDLSRLGTQPAFRPGSLPTGSARKGAMTASAVPYYDAIPPAELAEDVLEASFARGLASAECFEVRAAPYTLHRPSALGMYLHNPLLSMPACVHCL